MGRIVRCRGEPHGDLELDRVGVLELVEQDSLVALVEHPADGGPCCDESPCENEQVVELEGALGGAVLCRLEHPPPEHGSQHGDPAVSDLLEQGQRLIGELALRRPEQLDAVRIEAGPLPGRPGTTSTDLAAPVLELHQTVDEVAERRFVLCRGRDRTEECEPFGLLVVARHGGLAQVEHPGQERCGIEPPRARVAPFDARLDEVPVLVEGGRDPASADLETEVVQPAQLDQFTPTLDDTTGRIRIVEEAVEQRFPAFLEGQVALQFVEHGESGWQPGRDRHVVEQSAGEGVEGADRRMIDVGGRPMPSCGDECVSQSVPQFGCRLLGEGDRRDRADVDAGFDEADDAAHQAGGLAGTRARLDEQIGVEVGGDPLAGRSVGRGCRAHVRSSSPNQRSSRASCRLRLHSAKRSSTPRPSGWQYQQVT